MAVPVVTNISPASGHTTGLNAIRVLGFGFQEYPEDTSGGPLQQTVNVTIGGRAADTIQVINSSLLYARVPRGVEGAADVVIENIDANGDLIPGETVTVAGGYTYLFAKLTTASSLTVLNRALLTRMREQIIPNVSFGQNTDYTDAPSATNITQIAQVPGIALIGPQLTENRFYSLNGSRVENNTKIRPPYTVDVTYEVVGVSNNMDQLTNLQQLVTVFFDFNRNIEVVADPGDPGAGTVEFEMDWEPGNQPTNVSSPDESNLRSFSGRALVRGFDISCVPGFELPTLTEGRTATVLDVSLDGPDNC